MSLENINDRLERIEKQNQYILGNQLSILELLEESHSIKTSQPPTKFLSKDFMLPFSVTLISLICYAILS